MEHTHRIFDALSKKARNHHMGEEAKSIFTAYRCGHRPGSQRGPAGPACWPTGSRTGV